MYVMGTMFVVLVMFTKFKTFILKNSMVAKVPILNKTKGTLVHERERFILLTLVEFKDIIEAKAGYVLMQ